MLKRRNAMKYVMMICSDEVAEAKMSPQEMGAMMQAYGAFTNEVTQAGIYHGGEALHPTTTATTVRVRGGEVLTTDGPFAETKEQIAGFYLLDCKNLDEAIQWAAKIPSAKYGTIEIRPVMDFSQSAQA
jgi:hypothetical protein